jgi:hypothetical protein
MVAFIDAGFRGGGRHVCRAATAARKDEADAARAARVLLWSRTSNHLQGACLRPLPILTGVFALLLAAPAAARAQDSLTVAAGPHYDAGGLRRLLLGDGYRDAWTTPVRIAVLDPDTFAGGLEVIQLGGGLSTDALRLRGADGREYVFRSVDKDARRSLPDDLQRTLISAAAQDAVSAKHPAAALIVPPLAEAVGILHAVPSLYLMPDHPFLGEHRAAFAGRLGQVEERPEEADAELGGPGFAGAERVSGTEAFLDRVEDDPRERFDAREYLAARLLDVLIGDWDRHLDQWRWARFERGDGALWRPVPRDRDNATVRNQGVLLGLARRIQPQLVEFGPRYGDVHGLVVHASDLDRRLLSELDRAAWERAADDFRARITDDVIVRAVDRLPPEYAALHGAWLRDALRARRDSIPQAARRFYALLATEVDVHTTDVDEVAWIDRHPDGSVEVRVHAADAPDAPHFHRHFRPDETREVRLYLHGGDDHAVVRGGAERGMIVRIIGGGGDDVLLDSSRVAGGRRTVFHDSRGDNRFEPGRGARVDTRAWDEAEPEGLFGNAPSPRDWGSSFSLASPTAGWRPGVGPVVGVGPVWTRYGFRRRPHAERRAVQLLWAPTRGGFAVEAEADRVRTGTRDGTRLSARASSFDVVRFHGYGNRSPGLDEARYEVPLNRVGAGVRLYRWAGSRTRFEFGPEFRWTDPGTVHAAAPGEPLRGEEAYGQAGAEGEIRWDGRDDPRQPRSGAWARVRGRGYAAEPGGFGSADAEARAYLSVGAAGPTLALRGGGSTAFGSFPLQEAAFVGGGATLRGYAEQRFAGDAALYGGAEVRQRLMPLNLYVVRGRLGATALADAGRVYMDGVSEGGWHTAAGGGLWFETLGRVAAATLVRGDAWRLYITLGPPF